MMIKVSSFSVLLLTDVIGEIASPIAITLLVKITVSSSSSQLVRIVDNERINSLFHTLCFFVDKKNKPMKLMLETNC